MSIGTALKDKIFSPGHIETPKYKNVHIYPEQKWLGFAMFSFFSVRQREIKKHSHLDHPVAGVQILKDQNLKATAKVFGLTVLEGLQATEHSLARSHY